MAKREFATEHYRIGHIRDNQIVMEDKTQQVRIMARAEGWAMVRCKGCAPHAVSLKYLTAPKEQKP